MSKKIIIPNKNEIEIYSGQKIKKIDNLAPDPLNLWDRVDKESQHLKWAKNKIKKIFKFYKDWKEEVVDIINNTDYDNDKR